MIYGAVCADGAVHPVSLWPLDEKDPEEKAQALCQALRQAAMPLASRSCDTRIQHTHTYHISYIIYI